MENKKIYIIPVKDEYYLLPKINPFCGHSFGFNAETDFHNFIQKYPYLTDDPSRADYHYLPLYWSHWQLSHDYGRLGREEMARYLEKIVTDSSKTFTVSEADWEPNFGISMKVFSANTADNGWTPIPLITRPHDIREKPEKKYLASFVGNIGRWPMRLGMVNSLEGMPNVKIIQSKKGEDLFVDTILSSYTTLCPRGSALGSYRFYESMQLGVVPIMLSDYDFRPFRDKINWDEFSFFVDTPLKLRELLEELSFYEPSWFIDRGQTAQRVWLSLYNQGWCKYVLDYL